MFGTWSSPGTTHSNHLKKQNRNFASLVALIFLRNGCFIRWFFTGLIFWSHLLIKWLEAAIHSCARKNSCSVKLQGGPLNHNPRKIPVKNSWIIILQNNSKCLLLNDKQVPHEILFNLLQLFDEIQNTKKVKTRESKERRFEKK